MVSSVMPTYGQRTLAFASGDGAYLLNEAGERYLDFASGIAVTALGHAHPALIAAIKDQAGKLWHTSNLYEIPGQERLAKRLVEHSFADLVFFNNSGAEAVECAIKTARKYQSANGAPQRYRIITMEGAFHGRTLATIAAGGQEKHLDGFGPPVDGFDHIPFGDIEALKAAIGEQTAAIMFEPVRGEGGIKVMPAEFLEAARALADEHGLLVIYDEIQCGMGRTGKLFAYEHSGIAPDIMTIAKALGGGFPVGACLATEAAAAGMTAGTHGSTFGGNALAMAAGNAVLDVMLEPGFLERVEDLGGYLGQKIGALIARHPGVLDSLSGVGLMRGLKCKGLNLDLVGALVERHLLTVGAGDNQVRLLPPLIVSEDQIDEAVAAIDEACAALAEAGASSS